MSFLNDGTYQEVRGQRPMCPVALRTYPSPSLHHMIDWPTLQAVWNALARLRSESLLRRYLRIIRYAEDAPAARDRVIECVAGGQGRRLGDEAYLPEFTSRLCWQGFNLFGGPLRAARPPHAPDPADMVLVLGAAGATDFDFPIVAPPHGKRAQTLWRAYQLLRAALPGDAAAPRSGDGIARVFDLLEPIHQLNVIPPYDFNWFGVLQPVFWQMTPPQRRVFYEACVAHSRAGRAFEPDELYRELFRP